VYVSPAENEIEMPYRRPRGVLRHILTIALLGSTGCSLIGLGVGSSAPRYRDVPRGEIPVVRDCEHARVDYRLTPDEDVSRRVHVVRADADGLRVRMRDGHEITTPWSSIGGMSCRDGSYALPGLAIGLALDVVAAAFLVSSGIFEHGFGAIGD